MKQAKNLKHREGINQVPNQKPDSTESRGGLRHLIYWMEHDRSLNVQPDRIFKLRKLLGDEPLSMGSIKEQE